MCAADRRVPNGESIVKFYQILAHLNSDIGRFFKGRALKILELQKMHGNAYASYEKGEIHAMNGEGPEAMECWHFAARRGVKEAQFALGKAYFDGNFGTECDYITAMHWFQKLIRHNEEYHYIKYVMFMTIDESEKDYIDRLSRLSNYYINRIRENEESKNFLISFQDYRMLKQNAKDGDIECQYLIGTVFSEGHESRRAFLPPRYDLATSYWEAAAEQGHVKSQLNLAFVFATGIFRAPFRGKPVEHDSQKAKEWWQIAAASGHHGAQRELGILLFEHGQETHARSLPMRSNMIGGWLPISEAQAVVSEGISCLEAAARGGDAEAQHRLAFILGGGWGVERDEVASFRWYRMAADSDETGDVKFALANIYMTGTGAAQSKAEALRWYVAAAEKGSGKAHQTLGHIYARGEIVERDYAEAAKWFGLSAEQERRDLEDRAKRDYIPKSEIYSFDIWYWLAGSAAKGCAECAFEIDNYYQYADEILISDGLKSGRHCDPNNILEHFHNGELAGWRADEYQEGQRKRARQGVLAAQLVLGLAWIDGREAERRLEAREYLLAAAEKGNALAMRILGDGRRRYDGNSFEASEGESASWYGKAAELGDAEGRYELAERLVIATNDKQYDGQSIQFDGNGSAIWPIEYQEAVEWYRKAGEQGHPRAQERLAKMLIDGCKGVKANKFEGLRWRRLAAESGYTTAQMNLAEMYAAGAGIQRDDEQAAIWFRRAANGGNAEAMSSLSRAYLYGRGVPQDGAEAMRWHRRGRRFQ